MLYHEADLNDYAAYPTQVEGTSIAGSVSAVPGTYYVYVYATAHGEQSYRLVVQPATGPEQEPELRIELERRLGSGVNWILYREGDTARPLLYPTEMDGKRMSAGFEAEPGRYHLYVYKYTDEDIHYLLLVR